MEQKPTTLESLKALAKALGDLDHATGATNIRGEIRQLKDLVAKLYGKSEVTEESEPES